MTTSYDEIVRERVLPHANRIAKRGPGFMVQCPAHEDRTASLSINPGRTHPVVFTCHAGCDRDAILAGFGLTWNDLCAPSEKRDSSPARADVDDWMPCAFDRETRARIPGHGKIAEYLYRDERGNVVFGVARCKGKGTVCQGFRQFRPDPAKRSGRTWSVSLEDGTKVGEGLPYRLPELLRAIANDRTVFVVGGEKDADELTRRDYPATCNAGGETTTNGGQSKWTAAHAQWLAGADVVICADRDETGQRWAQAVVASLADIARSIEVRQAVIGKDVSDHLAATGPEVTEYLHRQGRHLDVHGQPITRLDVRHLATVWYPKPAPTIDDMIAAGVNA